MISLLRRSVLPALLGLAPVTGPAAPPADSSKDTQAVRPDHWAFVKAIRPPLPAVSRPPAPILQNAIDNFVVSRLEREGLAPAVEASKAELIRRVTLDLTGLPPTIDEVDGFLSDPSPEAYEKVVNRLFASKRYGERMVWDWLDAARYADTNGYQGDPTRSMHHWRDWVINALNANMPFDQFTVWQVAGDLLPNATQDQLVATGFHRNHMINAEGGRIPEESRVDYVQDRVETTAAVWLGITLNCCRCHDHKFDPFTQKDYYRMSAYFNSIDESGGADAHPFARPVIELRGSEVEAKIAEAKRVEDEARKAAEAGAERGWQALSPLEFSSANGATLARRADGALVVGGPNPDKDSFTVTVSTDMKNITGFRVEALPDDSLVNRGPGRADNGNYVLTEVRVDGVELASAEIDFWQNDTHRAPTLIDSNQDTGWAVMPRFGERHQAVFRLKQPLAGSAETKLTFHLDCQSGHKQHVLGCFRLSATDAPLPSLPQPPAEARKRLDQARKAREDAEKAVPKTMVMKDLAQPRETHILVRGAYDKFGEKVGHGTPAVLPPLPPDAPANRLALARWLVAPENPLTARVTVNREWAKFFGTGIVKTPEDFGIQGDRPSHPELLDWLAIEFVESGWNVKKLERLIVTSATYRQSSKFASIDRDPENRLLDRGPRYRLPSWMLRDQALAVSGLLVEKLGGLPVKPYQPAGVWEDATFGQIGYQQDHGEALYRRSLYTFWRRIVAPTMFFDVATRQTCTVRTGRTNTPLHALITLNETTFAEAARHLGERAIAAGATDDERLTFAFRLCTARPPTQMEKNLLITTLARLRQHYSADPEDAKKLIAVGESKPNATRPPAELAAWAGLASVLLNLDETVTKE